VQEFIDRSRYYLATEYITKIKHCLDALPEEAVWKRPNDASNSIGNLLLHLSGNIRQWIVGGVGQKEVMRDRAAEFTAKDGASRAELVENLDKAVREVDAVLATVRPEQLGEARMIQGRNTTVMSAIYHVVEHFSMHTGQIVLMTKTYVPGSVSFYRDANGLAQPSWGGKEGMP
jgi:uncharacterized damage-inducible protein DinB